MGADIIGWRDCPLQEELQTNGFIGKIKLRTYKDVVETRVPQGEWFDVRLMVHVDGKAEREVTYAEIIEELGAFEHGIDECAGCPLSGGNPVGCYRYVTYPVDKAFEELLFEFFSVEVTDEESVANQLFQDVVSRAPSSGTGWHLRRGSGEGNLARRPMPLTTNWTDRYGNHYVDSAMVCMASFITLDHPALVVAYAFFWTEFLGWVDTKGNNGLNPATGSKTMAELRHVADLIQTAANHTLESGWTIVVDA